MVAVAFLFAAWVLSSELKRKERAGLLFSIDERITVGKPASLIELLTNFIFGFLFGFKLLGLFLTKPESITAQEYLFSQEGSWLYGIVAGLCLSGLKWYEKNKLKLKEPENRILRIWPHDRVGDIVVIGLIFGILGAKLFDAFEHWSEFISHPLQTLFSQSGLTFYGGLIVAAIAICWYAYKKNIKIKHLLDASAPALMIAYAIGRMGCQISGDGDWGIYNSAYVSDSSGNVKLAQPGEFDASLKNNATYFLQGALIENNRIVYVTDRLYSSLDKVPRAEVKAPGFLPVWLFAYTYPQNVNKDGLVMPGITDPHNRVLPAPVFPTPLYETLICLILFAVLWGIRKRIKAPYMLFGVYLIMNGAERMGIEMMRVNRQYESAGITLTQAEMIALLLMVSGIILAVYAKLSYKKHEELNA
jgi:prolipoprotein diacylglyceryltransferase